MNDKNILLENGVDLEKSLELLDDMSTYDEIMAAFLKNVDSKVEDIKKNCEAGDLEAYGRSAHSLKSDARYLGFTKVAEMAIQQEMEAKDGNTEYIHEHIDDFISAVYNMVDICKKYLVVKPVGEETDTTPKEKSILAVDDSDLIRAYIHSIFNTEYNVIVASDGSEAIKIIDNDKDRTIKAVLLDLNMPNVDGFGVLEHFRENNLFSKYPVSVITGIDDKELINKAFTYNIIDMLQKPFTEKDVKRILETTLSRGGM